jgi:hypothetical protein
MKETSKGKWLPELGVAEVMKAGGNYWRTTGYSINTRSFLYPEEALYLVEEKKIAIEDQGGASLTLEEFYGYCAAVIPLACYLTYVKLKVSLTILASCRVQVIVNIYAV